MDSLPSARSAATQRTSLPLGDPSPTYDVVTPIDDESRNTALHYLCSIPRYDWSHADDFAPYMEHTDLDQGRFFLPELAICRINSRHLSRVQLLAGGAELSALSATPAQLAATKNHPTPSLAPPRLSLLSSA